MKILITGGMGFIGSNLVHYLIKNTNHKVYNIDAQTDTSVPESLKTLDNKRYFSYKLNICNYKKLKKIIIDIKPNIIMHLAAESHVDTSIVYPRKFIDTNILGTFNLLDISKKHLVQIKKLNFKFLHVSTDEVFGSLSKGKKSFVETSNYLPNSPYSASKAASDHLVRSWVKTYNFPAITTHCSNNFGPWQYPEKLIPHVISRCLLRSKIPVYGKGNNKRDWIHVLDHIRALYLIIQKGKIGTTYNIGTNKTLTNIILIKKICQLIDRKNVINDNFNHSDLITYVKDRKGHDFKYSINSSKLLKELNFKFKYNFNSGLEDTVDWYINNSKWLIKSFNKKFSK